MGLETIIDEENYESVLFDISRNKITNKNYNNKQKYSRTNFLIHKLKETDDTFYTNSLK